VAQSVGINEAARRLGVCPDTVRRHVRLGLLPAKQKPRGTKYQWLVELPDVQAAPAVAGDGPNAQDYERLKELVAELRGMLGVATAELDARRKEVAQLLSLLEQSQHRR
jgi:hypothetical protein